MIFAGYFVLVREAGFASETDDDDKIAEYW